MRTGPQIECVSCRMPMLLAFAEPAGPTHRRLSCPWCGHAHLWSVVEVRGSSSSDDEGGDGSRPSLGSSVE